jgi:hypothetical protein
MGTPSGRLCDAVLKLINLLWIKRKMTGAEEGFAFVHNDEAKGQKEIE